MAVRINALEERLALCPESAEEPLDEVRVRLLIVVGPDGEERARLSADESTTSLRLTAPGAEGALDSYLDLLAERGQGVDEEGRDVALAGLYLFDRDEITASLCSGGTHGRADLSLWDQEGKESRTIRYEDAAPGPSPMDRIKGLEALVGDLTRRLENLATQLAIEVRTERLVVVDQVGHERIATTVTPTASTLAVVAPGPREPGIVRLEAVTGETIVPGPGHQLETHAGVSCSTLRPGTVDEDRVTLYSTTGSGGRLEVDAAATYGPAVVVNEDGLTKLEPKPRRR